MDDATILHRVNDAIENSHDVHDVDLTISVLDGVVTLSGTAKTFPDKWASVSAAHQSHARHVTDNIVVRPSLR
ncbi:MAG TPA: BON domain-containing protein [Candidatus Acidoferrales bacterium]|nr:BON domain-containing protein [Candidatus Acidoferrales bacterium]